MGLFSCCTNNVIENVVTETIQTPLPPGSISARKEGKLTSATSKESKESKDSGYAAEPDLLDSDIDDDLHQGDGDTIDIGRREDDINTEENNFITESSSEVTVNRIISADRPQTPEFCLTGTQITQETVEKKQKEHVLTELSSQHIIAKPVVATSGCAFTIGEVGEPNMRRLPPRLPPIHQKNNRKTIDRQTIESNLKKAENNKQLRLSLIREKSFQQEERRQRALERKAAIMDLSADLGGNKAKRQLHNEDELIPPALENFSED